MEGWHFAFFVDAEKHLRVCLVDASSASFVTECSVKSVPSLRLQWTLAEAILLCGWQVRQRDDEAAMAFGRSVLVKAASTGEDQELLQDALSLLGYNDPASSPCGNLLGTKVGHVSIIT